MKSNTRTVLNTALTNASSYSSGSLDVGDLYELIIDFHVTAVTYTSGNLSISIGRIGADGHLYNVYNTASITGSGDISLDMGISASDSTQIQKAFGDQIQLDLVASAGNSISTTISIKGK